MRHLLYLLALIFSASTGGAAFAQEPSVDWKFYGGATVPVQKVDVQVMCFYDAKGITQRPGAHIRVWTKCLRQKDLDGVDIKNDFGGAILEQAAQKMVDSYVPPIAKVETVDLDQAITITQYEVTANISNIQPQARIFYELNCPERMLRELSMSVEIGGKRGFRDKPSDWRHVSPEGNGATLLKLLCPSR